MNPAERRTDSRRSTDAELAVLAEAYDTLADDVKELKNTILDRYGPRIASLEEWRIALAAAELEREKNRGRQEANVISKRQFWFGIASVLIGMFGSAVALAAVVISHT